MELCKNAIELKTIPDKLENIKTKIVCQKLNLQTCPYNGLDINCEFKEYIKTGKIIDSNDFLREYIRVGNFTVEELNKICRIIIKIPEVKEEQNGFTISLL